jgi:TRAP-type C4-dicarboxylate transport system permease small subunit
MKRFAEKMGACFDKVNDLLALLAGIGIVILTVLVTAEVVMRYFFNQPIQGSSEGEQVLMILICFLGGTWILKRDEHIVLDVVLSRLSPRQQALANVVTSVVGAVTCLFTGWFGVVVAVDYTRRHITTPGMLDIPQGPILMIIAIGFLFLFVQFLRRTGYYWNLRHTSASQVLPSARPDLS